MSVRFRMLGVIGVVFSSCLAAIGCSGSSSSSAAESVAVTDTAVTTAAESVESAESTRSIEYSGHSRRNALTQFGTADQLNRSVFDGATTVREIKGSGDFGVGTYNALDGEMSVLDGVVYRFTSDGVLRVAHPNDLVPFAAVTAFHSDADYVASSSLANYAALQAFVTNAAPDQNGMFAVKVYGIFSSIKTRAPRRQSIPYPPPSEAVKTQVEFTNANIRGTLVGFRLPAYLGTANATGYHFHFVSDDHQIGGHVLDVAVSWATVEVQHLDRLQINVPQDD